jgi:hypothetical protein
VCVCARRFFWYLSLCKEAYKKVLCETHPSKTYLKVSYMHIMRLLNLIEELLYIALHISTDIVNHQVFKSC